MKRNLLFYIAGGLMGVLLLIYIIYLLNFLFVQLSVVSRADLQEPEVVTFNLEKIKELKVSQ
jgi:hypothetical protein